MLLAVPAIGHRCYGDVGLTAALAPGGRVPAGCARQYLALHSMIDARHAAGMR